jgi:RNA polymerase sigma-70 factor (ECF subfamily)
MGRAADRFFCRKSEKRLNGRLRPGDVLIIWPIGEAAMARETTSIEALIAQARAAPEVFGELLQRYRPYLNLVASQRIDPRIVRRVCEADLVQQTLAEAAARFGTFRGGTEAEFSAWIQTILSHVLEDVVRVHVLAAKRSVTRERPLYYEEGSASFYWFDFTADETTPSKVLIRGERALRLAKCVEALPGRQGTAIRLRFFEGMKVRQIAETMSLSRAAVAGLLKRGLRILRDTMNEDSWFSDAVTSQP